MQAAKVKQGKLSLYGLALFALPAVMQGFMHGPATNFIQGIYAKHAGISLATLGTAVMITRLFDAFTDPIIGHISDSRFHRTGSRKPLIALGTLVTAYSLWCLFRPPEDVDIYYFTFWFVASYLGWTITEIPYRAWSVELTSEYRSRTNISTALAIATFAGTILFYLTPLIGHQFRFLPSTNLDFEALGLAAIVIVIAMPLCNTVTLWTIPNGLRHDCTRRRPERARVGELVLKNPPLLYFLVAFAFQGIATGMIQGVTFLFIDIHLSLGEQLSLIIALSLPISLLSLPFWGWASARYQKHRSWAAALLLSSLGYLSLMLIPGNGEGFYQLVAANCFIFFAVSATWIAGPAIIGDIADYGRLKFNEDLSGFYFSMYTLVQKVTSGLGVAAGLYILSLSSFDATATVQTDLAQRGLLLSMCVIPSVVIAGMAVFVWHFRLDRNKHRQVLRLTQARLIKAPGKAP